MLKYTILIMLLCSITVGAQHNLQQYYATVLQDSSVVEHIYQGKIELVNIYKQQIKAIYEGKNLQPDEKIEKYHQVYEPFKEYWDNFFSYAGFEKWFFKLAGLIENDELPGLSIPFEAKIDSILAETIIGVKSITNREPAGKWYLVYGNKSSNIGGFYNGDMFIDFAGIGAKGIEKLQFSLPHEINHQIYSNDVQDDGTLLYVLMDEGLACYVNYIYWQEKFAPFECISFTIDEWQWCVEHEAMIFANVSPYWDSTDEEIIKSLQRAKRFFIEGGPDRLGYFIGFRICQKYVEMHGENSWLDAYTMHPKEFAQKSNMLSR